MSKALKMPEVYTSLARWDLERQVDRIHSENVSDTHSYQGITTLKLSGPGLLLGVSTMIEDEDIEYTFDGQCSVNLGDPLLLSSKSEGSVELLSSVSDLVGQKFKFVAVFGTLASHVQWNSENDDGPLGTIVGDPVFLIGGAVVLGVGVVSRS
ncbi:MULTISPECIES: hypothetical protein [unclassified Streptomyces]|uniref:hypothetical protein n=1 Tax=unclassified Streptomyces TaxID=2593676 RepID=UPI002888929B|nr:hypothetical protein [Streptomyces sp. DSM 41633]